jgi:antirestriction protein ArdC
MATVYALITDRIVEKLQQGTVPWQKPRNSSAGLPRNLSRSACTFTPRLWASRSALAMGALVKAYACTSTCFCAASPVKVH